MPKKTSYGLMVDLTLFAIRNQTQNVNNVKCTGMCLLSAQYFGGIYFYIVLTQK